MSSSVIRIRTGETGRRRPLSATGVRPAERQPPLATRSARRLGDAGSRRLVAELDRPRRPLAAPASSRPRWPAARPAAASPWSRSAATAAASCARPATSTSCCSTTAGATSAEVAERLWYPIWDAGPEARPRGAHVEGGAGPGRRRPRHRHRRCSTCRPPRRRRRPRRRAGRPARSRQWQKRAKRWLAELADVGRATATTQAGEVAFLLEPDLKEGRGGLRDVHALRWAEPRPAGPARRRRPAPLAAAYARAARRRGSSCTAAPAGPATCCCSRSRTRWPPPSATPTPTR